MEMLCQNTDNSIFVWYMNTNQAKSINLSAKDKSQSNCLNVIIIDLRI